MSNKNDKKDKKQEFHKDMTIADVLAQNPNSHEVLSKYFSTMCLTCGAAAFETIELACTAHNVPDKLEEVLKELNCLKPYKKSD